MNELHGRYFQYTLRIEIEIGSSGAMEPQGDDMGKTEGARVIHTDQIEKAHMDAQIAVLQVDIAHIKSDLSELKIDVRELRGSMQAANDSIGQFRTGLKDDIAALRVEMEKLRGSQRLAIALNTIGQLLSAGTILGVMGRALKWF